MYCIDVDAPSLLDTWDIIAQVRLRCKQQPLRIGWWQKGGMQMPYLFLSPSTQEFNPYVTTQNEEYWMNLLADRMEPYLLASGIGFTRNDPDQNAAAAIRQSNAGTYDFHL